MAELVGMIKFKGQLDNLVAYYLNGKLIVRRKTSVDKNRINTDKAFKNTRKVNKEFGAASSLSKAFRNSLKAISGVSFHRSTHSFLTAIFHRLIRNGQGVVGQRTFNWNEANIDLAGLMFTKSTPPKNLAVYNLTTNNGSIAIPNQRISLLTPPHMAELQATYFLIQLPSIAFDEEAQSYKIYQGENAPQMSALGSLPIVNGEVNFPNYNFNQVMCPAIVVLQLEENTQNENQRNPVTSVALGILA